MGTNYSPEDVASGFRSQSKINDELQAIRDALDRTLSRFNDIPNTMESDLDMNSNAIINLGEPIDPTAPARKVELDAITERVVELESGSSGGSSEPIDTPSDSGVSYGTGSISYNRRITILREPLELRALGFPNLFDSETLDIQSTGKLMALVEIYGNAIVPDTDAYFMTYPDSTELGRSKGTNVSFKGLNSSLLLDSPTFVNTAFAAQIWVRVDDNGTFILEPVYSSESIEFGVKLLAVA